MSTRRFLPPLDTPSLSPGELTVLRIAHEGKSNAEIGRALGLLPKTVAVHLHHVMEKFRDSQIKATTKLEKGAPDVRPHGYR